MEVSTSNERVALSGFLDRQRDALVRKVRGVSDADARRAPTVSSLSLLGLLKHSAVWEDRWFAGVVAGRPLPDGWPERKSPTLDEDFLVDDRNWAICDLVVSTGHWWSGRHVLVPPRAISSVSWEESKVFVKLTRAEIQREPEYQRSAI